jgi:hypothetical protein
MVRRRWPDIVIVVGIIAMLYGGVWVLWGEDLRAWWHPAEKHDATQPAAPQT